MMRKRSWNLSEVLTEDRGCSRHERRGGALMRRAGGAMWRFEVVSGRGRWRSPCRWTVDRAPVRPNGNNLGKLALRRKVTGDAPAIGGMETEVSRALAWIEHDCSSLEFVSYKIERSDEVRIAGDNGKSIGGICIGIVEKRCGEIDVRPLLFHLYHVDKSICGCRAVLASCVNGRNPRLVLVVVSFDDIYAAMRNDGLKIDVLAFNRSGVVRICLGSGYKVLYCCEFVAYVKIGMGKHGVDERGDVKPLAVWPPAQQPVIEIATVYICYRFHLPSIKKIGSQTLRSKTLFRVGRALRLDVNPLKGSALIVPNRAVRNKRANLKNCRRWFVLRHP